MYVIPLAASKATKVRVVVQFEFMLNRVAAGVRGNLWIWLPPRRFAPPLLFQEGSWNFKLDY